MIRILRTLAVAVLSAVAAVNVAAQSFPTKPVRMILPFPPGSGVDAVARHLSAELKEVWGTQPIIDNRPGASGKLAVVEFNQQPADGYTLLLAANDQLVVNRVVYKSPPYDIANLLPIAGVYRSTFVVAASAASGIKSVKDLIARAKQSPGKLTYATLGKGTLGHIAAEQFALASGISLLHIPYKDLGSLSSGLGGGDVDLSFLTMASLDANIKSGRVIPLASLSAARQTHYPDLPTVAEAGGPVIEIRGWLAVVVAKNTPAQVADQIQADVLKVVSSERFKAKIGTLGFDPYPAKGTEVRELASEELKRYREIASRPGMQLDE